ncbi:MAG TPA: AbrB/MazE/SpoVT family DNA-binding domain-containing protein [Candidatus Limnocylindria bacterium]|nr:AbrB/MazE/SpoVT family DNA-binding domain-containing protein [Candidatus Limnocylindria bacterium]
MATGAPYVTLCKEMVKSKEGTVVKETRPGRSAVDATLTSKGQLTLPAPVRQSMGVVPGDKVRFAPSEGGGFLVTPVRRGDVLALDGAFAAGKRLGALEIRELRRRAATGRTKTLAARR